MSRKALALKIRDLRLKNSWSQEQLASVAHLSLRTIQRVEKTGHCSPETLLSLASAFDLDVKTLTQILEESQHHTTQNPLQSSFTENENKLKFLAPFTGNRAYAKYFHLVGFLLSLPALYFVSANILKYYAGIDWLARPLEPIYTDPVSFKLFNIISPFIFLGGTLLAIVLNIIPFLKIGVGYRHGSLKGNLTIQITKLPIPLIGMSIILMTILLTYAIMENL